MNVQYAIKDGDIYVLEVNPRASRTVPFVAKVIGLPVAKIAARVMAGETLASFDLKPPRLDHVGVKEAVFPFARFPGVDTVLGPEMKSTGEVMGLDHDFEHRLRQEPARRRRAAAARAAPCSSRCATPTSRASCEPMRTAGRRSASRSSRPRGTQRYLAEHGRRGRQDQQGARKAARISSTPSRTARFSWFSTPPRGPRRWPTAGRCAALPSCIKCRTTPLFPGPSLRRRASKPISGATSRCARCRAISAAKA